MRPFLVDPSSRATEWLKAHLKDQRLEVVNQQVLNSLTCLCNLFTFSLFFFCLKLKPSCVSFPSHFSLIFIHFVVMGVNLWP